MTLAGPPEYTYFDIKVSLVGPSPEIYRRFLLRQAATFEDLHEAIQSCSGWENRHLYSFSRSNPYESGYDFGSTVFAISEHDELEGYGARTKYACEVSLLKALRGSRAARIWYYQYDYGDGWVCRVEVLAERAFELKFDRLLIGGARAFPKEDCGGLHGYQQCVEFRETGRCPDGFDAKHMRSWLGRWQPEAFKFEAVAKRFARPKAVAVTAAQLGVSDLPQGVRC